MIQQPTELEPAPADEPHECELKLAIDAAAIPPLRDHPLIASHVIGPVRVSRIANRYFDTPDRLLSKAHLALRLRRIGRHWMQTLKVAQAGDTSLSQRGEWEMPLASPRLMLGRFRDAPLAAIGSARTLARRLVPLFATNFRRETRQLRLADGSIIELAIDVGTIRTGRGKTAKTEAICEVELELKSGDARALLRFAHRLAQDVPLLPLPISKAERGLALVDESAPAAVKVDLPKAAPDRSARAHLARVVAACQRALLLDLHPIHACDVAAGGGPARLSLDPEFVHQARVAVRRMRSALRTFRPVIGKRRFDALDTRLRVVGGVLGDARDRDVFCGSTIARIARIVGDDDAGRAAMPVLRATAERLRDDAHARLIAYLHAPQAGADAIAVERFILRFDGDGGAPLAELAPNWLDRQHRRVVGRARRIAVLDDEERHRLRIEVKRLRYAIDLLDALYEDDAARRYRKALGELQDELGELNDAVVAARLLHAMGNDAAIALGRERFDAWLAQRINKRLPKIAALSVAFELTPRPWKTS